jgi:hypothetical protein
MSHRSSVFDVESRYASQSFWLYILYMKIFGQKILTGLNGRERDQKVKKG